MQNIGEEIAGEYLRIFKECDFIRYNLQNPNIQGEIDVVAVSLKTKTAYLCEVAVHLSTGLMYVDQITKQPNNVKKLIQKLEKDLDYAKEYLPDYTHILMLWSPIVRESKEKSKHNQIKDIAAIAKHFKDSHNVSVDLVVNKKYWDCLVQLREYAAKETKELQSPVLRLMQIEERLRKSLKKEARKIIMVGKF